MNKLVHKCFWLWEFEKEEQWLNEMAEDGWQLQSVGFCRYEFKKGIPGEYIIRLGMLDDLPNHPQSQSYIEFMESTGAEYIGSVIRWVYFRKKADSAGFDLRSDLLSKINHLKRILALNVILVILELTMGFQNLMNYFESKEVFTLGMASGLLLVGAFLSYGALQLYRKKKQLERQNTLQK